METTQTKKCSTCKIVKETIEFAKDPRNKSGLRSQCKSCEKAHKQLYYEKNKKKILKHNKEYRDVNKESIAEQKKEYVKRNKKAKAKYNKEYRKTDMGRLVQKNSEGKRRVFKRQTSDGTIPQIMTFPLTKELQELLHIQDNKCNNCRCDITKDKHLDHHIPLSKGGTHSISNVVFLCPTCNLTKHSTMPTTLMLVM